MQAILIERTGGPQTLRLSKVPVPSPAPGQVQVKVGYATLNPLDVAARSGAMQWGVPAFPFILGTEYAGRVVAVGADVDRAIIGQRVAVRGQWGGFAEIAVAPVEALAAIPDGLDLATGTVYRSTCLTAWHALHTVGRIRARDVVLLHSAAGPVAILAAQIAREAGATVLGLAGGPAKAAFAIDYGYDQIIDYRDRTDWPAQVKALTGGRGADLIIDGVQGPAALRNLDALARLGQILFLGQSGGPGPDVPIGRLIAGSACVRGMVVHDAVATSDGQELPLIDRKMLSGAWRYPLNPPVPIARIAETFAAFEARALSGRTVFTIGGEV